MLYVNDLPNVCIKSTCLLYADDTALIFEGNNVANLQGDLDYELPIICEWLKANKLSLNTKKTVYQLYNNTRSAADISVNMNNDEIQCVEKVRYLGVIIDQNLKWNFHIDHITAIISRNIGIMNRSKFFLDKHSLTLLYNTLILPYINYCCIVWGFTFPTYLQKLELLQKRAVRIIDNQHRLAHADPIFHKLKLLKVQDIAKQQLIILMHRSLIQNMPAEIDSLFVKVDPNILRTRRMQHFLEPFTAKLYRTRVSSWIGPRLWNSIISPEYSLDDARMLTKYYLKKITKSIFLQQFQ